MTTAFVVADGPLRAHLLRALTEHSRWCRSNAIPIPVELSGLFDALEASSGQELPEVDRDLRPVDDPGVMNLLCDYVAAGRALGLSGRQVRRLVADGKLHAVRIGRLRRIRRSDLEAFAASPPGVA
jgi:excisionase family DNA binding protein